jgi:aminoglycoside phosphotransferase (APT) family kinase protein
VAFDAELTYPLLLQRALTGRPLGPDEVRRRRASAVAKVLAWCDKVAAATVQPSYDVEHLERLVLDPVRMLAGPAGPGGAIAELARRTLPLAQELVAARPPLVFEHGDLGHPNLLVARDGSLGVLDFERAELTGLPGHDLLAFCAYAAASASRRGVGHGIAEAFHGRSPWAAEAFAAHLRRLAVEPELGHALLTVACARIVAQAVEAGAGPVAGGRDAAARHLALWQGSVERDQRPAPGWSPTVVTA